MIRQRGFVIFRAHRIFRRRRGTLDEVAATLERAGRPQAHIQLVLMTLRELVDDRAQLQVVAVSAHHDATVIMIRDPNDTVRGLDERRSRIVAAAACRWSTMSGPNGRTISMEVPLVPAAPAARDTRPCPDGAREGEALVSR